MKKRIFIIMAIVACLNIGTAQTKTEQNLAGRWKLKSQWKKSDRSFFKPHAGQSIQYFFENNGKFTYFYVDHKISLDTTFITGKWRLNNGSTKIYLYGQQYYTASNRKQPYEAQDKMFKISLTKSRLLIKGESLSEEVDFITSDLYTSEYLKS